MTNRKSKFSTRIFLHSLLSNLLVTAGVFALTSMFLLFSKKQLQYAAFISCGLFFISEFTVDYLLTYAISSKIEKDIEKFESEKMTSIEEKTQLFKSIMHFPYKKSILNFLYGFIAFSTVAFIYNKIPAIGINVRTALASIIPCAFGAYISSILSFTLSENITNTIAENLIHSGIDENTIYSKNLLGVKRESTGLSLLSRIILYIFIPTIFANLTSYLILKQGYMVTNNIVIGVRSQILRTIMVNLIYLVSNSILVFLLFKHISKSTEKLRSSTTELLTSGKTNIELKTSLGDQIQYNIFLLDKIIRHYDQLIGYFSEIGNDIFKSTESLSSISKEISAVSQDQSADVKEILTTMEDSNSLSKNISTRISEVSNGTDKTKYEVSEAFYLLKETIQQLTEINSSNQTVIDGIKALGKKIDSINDIVAIIRDIASQTKIIAFNAELESVRAGKAGRNFHIVAAEIRRLANNSVASIDEIQNYITNIQEASHSLISFSEKNMENIASETSLTKELELQFTGIMQSSNETNSKANEITNIIEQQTNSFNQIVITLRQISVGIESFSLSTNTITDTVDEMKFVAEKLSNFNLSNNEIKEES